MDKEEVLNRIKDLSSLGMITEDEVLESFYYGKGIFGRKGNKNSILSTILYYIGGAIVFLGIVVLIWQSWDLLSSTTRILSSFGAGLVAYIVAVILNRHNNLHAVGNAFHLIAGLVLPVGLFVIFDSAGFDITSFGVSATVSAILFVLYLISFAISRTILFALFNIIFGTWFIFSFTSFLVGNSPQFGDSDFEEYRAMLVAVSYILLGYSFLKNNLKVLTGVLYSFGLVIFFITTLVLGGYSPEQNMFWEVAFPILVFIGIWLSVRLRSKSFLTFSSIFLMVYIIKITSEYFANSLGWPFTLVLSGLLLIVIGFVSLRLNKKYITLKQ
ncbi:hypothetical protein H6775_02635 [Candidatus Nomurabacteria bacterium]|nr:hypothetical protein [Candidatus Nomurabacteria bacterium]